ncbi:MAG: hypothetical protein JRG76_06345 [Deltaproteobacteria bacterium]|nr:hypothetical protein [Deltaproteobacteria bacterium]
MVGSEMVEFFPMVPASGKAWAFFGGLALLFVGLALGMLLLGWGIVRGGFELSPDGLRLRGAVYGRMIPATSLDAGAARLVDFRTEPGLRPRRRTNGIGLPGYLAGWVTLHNGDRALTFLTDYSRVVYIPTSEGYGVMLSVCEPDQFLSRLRAVYG